MYAKLTIPERLKDLRVVDKHLTLEQLAEQTGLSKSALGKYETDDYKDISPFAIATLADFYGVSTDYLMGLTENKNHPNTELQSLHLSDDMVELLSSGKINNRLLCELATHPNFRRLMIEYPFQSFDNSDRRTGSYLSYPRYYKGQSFLFQGFLPRSFRVSFSFPPLMYQAPVHHKQSGHAAP